MQNLAHYAARSPRYLLQPLDNKIIRFTGPDRTPWDETTEIRNISLSGLAFTVPPGIEPRMKEILALEFEVPGQEDYMACHAQVVRLERVSDQRTLVSVRFFELTANQKFFLLSGLLNKLKAKEQSQLKSYFLTAWRALMTFAALMAIATSLYVYYMISLHSPSA